MEIKNETRVWEEKVTIPTYKIGEPQKNPMFLEKRVYQGSSGKVYPYPTIESISEEREDVEYTAVMLENEYLKVMVLPQLGGRIQRAYDKTNGYDFVYYNHVIKPALVGLTGPWISGGIEFNWPQHHRPTTFLPVDYELFTGEEGEKSVLLHDVDQMYGTKAITKLTLYPGRAYIEVTGQLYNRTPMPQTFLWWANPAVAVNDQTQSIFPPDVHAVMDHGKRDVSRFPIATGIYYKKDYSDGVDISRYKNIPVPTSYMAEKSNYDFVGGYDYGRKAGLLHVADHHISPGKKQWTWGCGDFGQAWDRNLTDADGPYIELMTGVYTDNQPDFTWLKPFEEKTFHQYFMPYKTVGQVKNATTKAMLSLVCKNNTAEIAVYATSRYEKAQIRLWAGVKQKNILSNSNITDITAEGRLLLEEETELSPVKTYEKTIDLNGAPEEELYLEVLSEGKLLVSYQPEKEEIQKLPEPAQAAKEPSEILTNEELYLTGQHLEQYRHATFCPDDYYLEGLKRDPGDIRINNAYGLLLFRRGQFAKSEEYFRKALERLTWKNPNPYHGETFYLLGLALFYQGEESEAYDTFFKAAWSNEQQEMSYYYLAAIDAKNGRWKKALEHIEKSLIKNAHNIKARGLKAYLLRNLGRVQDAIQQVKENLLLDPFDFVSGNEEIILESCKERNDHSEKQWNLKENADLQCCGQSEVFSDNKIRQSLDFYSKLHKKMRDFPENYLMAARDYAEFGAYEEACILLRECGSEHPLLKYYEAYYIAKMYGEEEEQNKNWVEELLQKAEQVSHDCCFPNKLEDIAVLSFAVKHKSVHRAAYDLGNLMYDRLQWQEAIALWEKAAAAEPDFATVHRNLAIAYYNKKKDESAARRSMELAFSLDTTDARVFLELDQLYKKLGMDVKERLSNYKKQDGLAEQRDDLYVEYITLLNAAGHYKEALDCMMTHHFHPWEGGEGKITTQYELSLLELAKECMAAGDYSRAEELLRAAFIYPQNLGEGKLEGTKDNHLYYYLGQCLKAQKKDDEARECWQKATLGTDEPAGAMYYNDQPAEMILYQGLAWQELGMATQAKSRFYRLLDYGERHLYDNVKIDYFAVSLPDFIIFDEDYTLRNKAHCYYLMALGNLGLGKKEKAKEFFQQAAESAPAYRTIKYGISFPAC